MIRKKTLAVVTAAVMMFAAGCGGNSLEEELVEQLAEGNEDIANLDINTDGNDIDMTIEGEDGETINVTGSGDDDFEMTIEGEDGETINVTGSGDDDDFEMTIEGEDGESMTISGSEIPEDMVTPVADGGDVLTSMTMPGMINLAIGYPASMFDELVTLYDGVFTGDGIQRWDTSSDGQRAIGWVSANGEQQVSVADCDEGESEVCVTIMEISE